MKFSVLIPTRERLEFLQYAIETVRLQDYDDWEIIVSDNFSEQDIGGFVASLGDSRIRYFRTKSPVPVTENWNNALNRSTGDYVLMLGDDDALLQRYFSTMVDRIDRFDQPDLIYTSALIYAYPGVLPGNPDGYLHRHPGASFLQAEGEPFWLEKSRRIDLVQEFMNFRMRVNCNMQHSLMSRKLIESLRGSGDIFQSPFPDYYATNSNLLVAERVLVDPRPYVTIGISPKSYGYFHFNNREAEGTQFLGSTPASPVAERLKQTVLPGPTINTSWLFAAEAIKENFGSEFKLRVGYWRYRLLQIAHGYRGYYIENSLTEADLDALTEKMRWGERAVYRTTLAAVLAPLRFATPSFRSRVLNRVFLELTKQYPRLQFKFSPQHFSNIVEVFGKSDPLGP